MPKDSAVASDGATAPHGQPVMRRRPRLAWRDGAGAHEVVVDRRMVVGSAPAADLVVDDRTVSRIHAELVPGDDGLWVRDLGSRNGTYFGDVRIEGARAAPETRVRFGGAAAVVSYEPDPAPVELWSSARFGDLIGASAAMRELFALLGRVSGAEAPVLISGETGTGKELVARAIHDASGRARGPFIVVDCGALPESLLEAELFGHARGAFTGATAARAGAIEAAEGGTVFLDEIGELPTALQPKLLRVLESREIRRVGEAAHRKVDVRFVSATHRDLRRMVNTGAVREDLYFRLAVLVVSIPPLRDRLEDLPMLARHLLGERDAALWTEDVAARVGQRSWPGNVRELRNFIERLRAVGPAAALAMGTDAPSTPQLVAAPPPDAPYRAAREAALERFERDYFAVLLPRVGRDVAEAARQAGVDRSYVYRMIRRYGL